MVDYSEEELLKRLRRGAESTEVVPQESDPEAALVARMRAQAIGNQLAAPTIADARGHVVDTPDWNLGKSILNGMVQGWLPEMAAPFRVQGRGRDINDPTLAAELATRTQDIRNAREAYGQQNPGKALLGETGGSMATLVPAMATGASALGSAARAVPWLSGIADFLGGSSLAGGAVRGGLEGAASAVGASGLSDQPLREQVRTGAIVGAPLGMAGRAVSNALGSHVNATTAETAQALIDQGVPVRAGQIPGSNKIAQGLDKVFGGGNAAQREAFGEKLTGYAGAPSKEVNQSWVANNDKRIGQTMNNIQSVYSIPALEPGLLNDLSAIRSHALSNYSLENAKKISGVVGQVEENLFNPMTGPVYKNLTQKGGLLDNISKDKDIANVVPKLREALDDAWGRALPADKKAAWDQARKEYKVTRVIDDSMGASGVAEGVYNPKKLLKAVEDRYGNVENAGELGLLARGGQFLEPPGAAPASAKHGAAKTIGTLALGGAAATAASEGSKVISHLGPEAIAALSQHPESYALPLMLAGGLYGGARLANSALNSPRATQYLLDVSRGSRAPLLQGNNPLIPFATEWYNRQ